jgi:dephospho-CoA kinase
MKVGLTGGIGSGKSTICGIFEWLGVPIYNADLQTKSLYLSNQLLKSELTDTFGEKMYSPNGEINKNEFKSILSDKTLGKRLNELVHPYVFANFENWVSKQTHPYVIKEAAILFESGADATVDTVISVIAPFEVKLKRIKQRDSQRSEAEILNIMNLQLSDEELMKRSDYIVYNDSSESVIKQVLALNIELLQKSAHFH